MEGSNEADADVKTRPVVGSNRSRCSRRWCH